MYNIESVTYQNACERLSVAAISFCPSYLLVAEPRTAVGAAIGLTGGAIRFAGQHGLLQIHDGDDHHENYPDKLHPADLSWK